MMNERVSNLEQQVPNLEQQVVSAFLAGHIMGVKPGREIIAEIRYPRDQGWLTMVRRHEQTIKWRDDEIVIHSRKPHIIFGRALQQPDRGYRVRGNLIEYYGRPRHPLIGRSFQRPDASIKFTRG